jgi:hypothetical protein
VKQAPDLLVTPNIWQKRLVILYPCALLPRKIEEKLKDTLVLRNITGNLMALSRRQN